MSKVTEIKVGSFHLIKDPNSGFWLNPNAMDPQSATMTEGEVKLILQEHKQYITNIIPKMEKALVLVETYLKDLGNE